MGASRGPRVWSSTTGSPIDLQENTSSTRTPSSRRESFRTTDTNSSVSDSSYSPSPRAKVKIETFQRQLPLVSVCPESRKFH